MSSTSTMSNRDKSVHAKDRLVQLPTDWSCHPHPACIWARHLTGYHMPKSHHAQSMPHPRQSQPTPGSQSRLTDSLQERPRPRIGSHPPEIREFFVLPTWIGTPFATVQGDVYKSRTTKRIDPQ